MRRLLFLREAIILNISVWRVGGGWGQLFEGDDESRDGYFSRKYGTSTCINIKIMISIDLLKVYPLSGCFIYHWKCWGFLQGGGRGKLSKAS